MGKCPDWLALEFPLWMKPPENPGALLLTRNRREYKERSLALGLVILLFD